MGEAWEAEEDLGAGAALQPGTERSAGGPGPRGRQEARDRLCRLGASALADHELVATLLSRARGRAPALVSGGLKALAHLDFDALTHEAGLSADEAARLLASLELGRRTLGAAERRPRLTSPQDIHAFMVPRIAGLRCEEFWVLCFNPRFTLLQSARVAVGNAHACQVDPREVFAPAVRARASGVVLVHNHPAGDPEPSQLDVALTLQLRDAGRLLCVHVHDHLVVGDRGFVSLAARGHLGDDARFGAVLLPRASGR